MPFYGPNADVAVAIVMLILTALLFLVPVIPGLERLPRYLGLHRIIWRDHYRDMERGQPTARAGPLAHTPKLAD